MCGTGAQVPEVRACAPCRSRGGAPSAQWRPPSARVAAHLQEWILADPPILGSDVVVVASGCGGFELSEGTPTYDQLDVLAIHSRKTSGATP